MKGKKGNVRYERDDGSFLVVGSQYIALEVNRSMGSRSRKTLFRIVSQRDGRRVFFKSYNPNIHCLKKLGAVGLNSDAMDHMKPGDIIALRHHLKGDTIYASVSEARAKGTYLNFKKSGAELQLFVPLEIFKKEIPQADDIEKEEGAGFPLAFPSAG